MKHMTYASELKRLRVKFLAIRTPMNEAYNAYTAGKKSFSAYSRAAKKANAQYSRLNYECKFYSFLFGLKDYVLYRKVIALLVK